MIRNRQMLLNKPNQHHQRRRLIKLNLIKAEGLASMDASGLAYPYVVVRVGGMKRATSNCLKQTLTPEFNFECTISASAGDTISLTIFDWDMVGDDEVMGEVRFAATSVHSVVTPMTVDLSCAPGGEEDNAKGKLFFEYSLSSLDNE